MMEEILAGIGDTVGRGARPSRFGDLDMGTDMPPASQNDVDRILAAGRRKLPAPDLIARHGAYHRAVRAAYMEGLADGSRGFLTDSDAEARHWWVRSAASRRLHAGEPACHAIGWKARCADAAASVITAWTIAAIYRGRIWLTARDVDVIVPGETVRLLTNEPLPL